jgi:hypothetical protein
VASVKKLYNTLIVVLIIALSVWLFLHDKAAEPGSLSRFHQDIADCKGCHVPWRGVADKKCLQCHEFSDVAMFKPEIRFHVAKKFCIQCHKEHRGVKADISEMDHTLLNKKILCTQCHLDQHSGLFGQRCRECHHITTWKVEGFRHPPAERKKCHRCHKPPHSHYNEQFWALIERGHFETETEVKPISRENCWLCHNTHNWQHLMMEHTF